MMGLIGWFWNAPAPGVLAQGLVALVAAVWLALVIDAWIGEPPPRWHPVVWMGSALHRGGEWVAPLQPVARDFRRFWLGALVWIALAAIVFTGYFGYNI